MILLFLMSVARYAKSTQNRYVVACNISGMNLVYEADVLRADSH